MTGEPAGDGLLTFELRDGIALVGLNRPEKRNAISDRVVEALDAAITRAEAEAQAAVLFGHGPHFSAGLDLAEHAERGMLEGIRNSRRWHEVFGRIEFGTIPWVCALHGAVVGGGLELAAAAHVRVADPSTFIALPEGTRGIFVGGGASVRVSRLMGVARMTDLMLTGRSASAEEAERWGVVQYLAEAGGAVAQAEALARKAAGNSAFSNYAIIHALPRIATMSGEDGLFVESFVASFASMTPEAGERLRAFLDKRAGKVGAPGT
jgi:(methylthio)acryloyl-CoA hydratase